MKKNYLIVAGVLSSLAALLHIGMIIGGPDWYRFFGAGEQMAQVAEQGDAFPAMVTSVIASVLAVWALYGFSGAGVIRRLPLLKTGLFIITSIYLARGLFGVAVIFLFEHPYFEELQQKLTFMIVSSLICLCIGLAYGVGTYFLWRDENRVSSL